MVTQALTLFFHNPDRGRPWACLNGSFVALPRKLESVLNEISRGTGALWIVFALLITSGDAAVPQWVSRGASGQLNYQLDSRGDRILDYSAAGYEGGAPLPVIESLVGSSRIVNLAPAAGDNRARIQAAIDKVAAMSVTANGYRGIVRLAAGQYDIGDSLNIGSSGIVLEGAGGGADIDANTILRSTSTDQISIILVGHTNHRNPNRIYRSGPTSRILDKVVPAGAMSFRVEDVSRFSVGDWLNVKHTPKQDWFDAIGVDSPSWATTENRFTTQHEREITRIEGDRVFLHAPISHSIDRRLAEGSVELYNDSRIDHVGIANIRGKSIYDASQTATVDGRRVFTDENHASNFILFAHAKDCWATGITGQHLRSSTVAIGIVSRSITVENASHLDPVSQITGGRRYAFDTNGCLILMKDLTVDSARRAFINNSTFNGFNRGPNVFLSGVATNSFVRSGPHAGYSTGALYDNIVDDGGIEARRATSPVAHGWRGAHTVIWNSSASEFQVSNPPFARNFLIGATGPAKPVSAPQATAESLGKRVSFNDAENPLDSLYVQQKLERQRFADIDRREYWIGDFDGFEFDGSESDDKMSVDIDWQKEIQRRSRLPMIGFDQKRENSLVPFSIAFSLAKDEQVASGLLTIATRGKKPFSENDHIYIDSLADSVAPGSIRVVDYDDGTEVLTIELVGDMGFLQDGLLNVLVTNHRSVDWAHLVVRVSSD